jgi:hypothetical protein
MRVRLFNQTVVEILNAVPGFSVEQCFHPDIIAASVDAPDEVQPGWTYNEDGTFTPPEPPVAEPTVEAAPEEPTDGA